MITIILIAVIIVLIGLAMFQEYQKDMDSDDLDYIVRPIIVICVGLLLGIGSVLLSGS